MDPPVETSLPAPARTFLLAAPVPNEPVDPRRAAVLTGMWLVVALLAMALVLYGLGPLFQQREQHQLLERYRARISQAAEEAFGLPGVSVPTKAPEPGDPVAIVEIGSVQLQQVVVEGVLPSQTARGPGHVPGTSAPGQPGNAVIVGRNAAFGGSFGPLGSVRLGDPILVTTTQGFVVYKVDSVRQQSLRPPGTAREASPANAERDAAAPGGSAGSADSPGTTVAPDPNGGESVDLDALFGATDDSRLTLVTSAGSLPTNSTEATVVVAKLEGLPFTPTPQNGRNDSQIGTVGDSSAWPAFGLVALAYAATVGIAIALYRRSSPVVAYVLTMAPLITFTILGAETISRLLPAWF